ncbi:hypothetical protein [Natrinema soli]|uniref:Uncharacterized protein n=1 Tax=Natrinema soli TaxID=1930624 RepID=A0ABD5SNB2_9EURY|nr:hypothetical protein [Natrinema soli]
MNRSTTRRAGSSRIPATRRCRSHALGRRDFALPYAHEADMAADRSDW